MWNSLCLLEKFETESSWKIINSHCHPTNTCKFFDTSEHMVKKARRLRKEKGPLGIPSLKKTSSTIPEHVIKDVINKFTKALMLADLSC